MWRKHFKSIFSSVSFGHEERNLKWGKMSQDIFLRDSGAFDLTCFESKGWCWTGQSHNSFTYSGSIILYSASLPWLCRCTPWCCIDSCPLPLSGICPPEYDQSATFFGINVNWCKYSYFEIGFKTVELSNWTISIYGRFCRKFTHCFFTGLHDTFTNLKVLQLVQGVRIAGQQNGVTYISCKCRMISRLKSSTIVAPVPGPREESKRFGNFSQIWWHWASSPTLRISLPAVKQRLLKMPIEILGRS